MIARGRVAIVVFWLAGLVALEAAGRIVVTPLVTDGRVLASFTAAETFDDDARELVRSGLTVEFLYQLELRRSAVLWFDDTLASEQVSAAAKYDTLTDTYQVSKLQGEKVTWSESTRDPEQVTRWMTVFEKIPLEPAEALAANEDYYLQVRLHQRPRRRFSLWPWGGDDGSGRADFTYIR